MKCKACGANYKTKDLTCPYCGETNLLGFHWKQEEEQAAENYQKTKRAVLKSMPFYVVDRMLNGILGIMGLIFVIICLFAMIEEPISEKMDALKRAKVSEARMEELYQADEYEALYDYMIEYCVYEEKEYTKYAQYINMKRTMNKFITTRIEFVTTREEEFAEHSRYGITYEAISVCDRILEHDWYPYCREILPENEEAYEQICLEVKAFLMGELEMTEQEVNLLAEGELIYTDAWDDFYQSIYERKGWEYGE